MFRGEQEAFCVQHRTRMATQKRNRSRKDVEYTDMVIQIQPIDHIKLLRNIDRFWIPQNQLSCAPGSVVSACAFGEALAMWLMVLQFMTQVHSFAAMHSNLHGVIVHMF